MRPVTVGSHRLRRYQKNRQSGDPPKTLVHLSPQSKVPVPTLKSWCPPGDACGIQITVIPALLIQHPLQQPEFRAFNATSHCDILRNDRRQRCRVEACRKCRITTIKINSYYKHPAQPRSRAKTCKCIIFMPERGTNITMDR